MLHIPTGIERDNKTVDADFERWFSTICVPRCLDSARRQPPTWDGQPLDWELAHEMLAHREFAGHQASIPEPLAAWADGLPPWGHGGAASDRRRHWLRRVEFLAVARSLGVASLLHYGGRSGHTALLARVMGLRRVVHHGESDVLPFVRWREMQIRPALPPGDFILSDTASPLSLAEEVEAVICTGGIDSQSPGSDEAIQQVRGALRRGGYLLWSSVSDRSGEQAAEEEGWLARHGFARVGDLPCGPRGRAGIFQSTLSRTLGRVAPAAPAIRTPAGGVLGSSALGEEFVPRAITTMGTATIVALGDLRLELHAGRYLDREIIEGRLFEADSVAILAGLVKRGQTVVDVGANFGYYSMILARWVGPTGRVIAFEPALEYSRRHQANLDRNRLDHVRLVRAGLSDCEDDGRISIGECSGTMHWTAPSAPRCVERIHLVRFDDWWSRYLESGEEDRLHFMKIDVDGHELFVLRGAVETIRRHRPVLLVEFYRPNFEKAGYGCGDLADYLENDLGYILHDEQTGAPFEDRAAFLARVDRPDQSFNVFCLPSAGQQGTSHAA